MLLELGKMAVVKVGVGGVMSQVKAWVVMLPRLPARSTTWAHMLLPLARLWFSSDQVVPPLGVTAVCQLRPSLSETRTDSLADRGALRLPLMVWAALLVMKSPLVPLSSLSARPPTVWLGAAVSKVKVKAALASLVLPATSVKVALRRWRPSAPSNAALTTKPTLPAARSAACSCTTWGVAKGAPASSSSTRSPARGSTPEVGRLTCTVTPALDSLALR